MLKQIILLLISVSLLSSGAENLIKNANFAQRNPDGTPTHWKIWPEKLARGVTAELDTTMSTSGGVSFRIRHDDQNHYTRISQIIQCKPHTKYVAFFKSKGRNINSSRGGGIRMFIGQDVVMSAALTTFGPAFDYFKLKRPADWSYDWKEYQSVVFNSGKQSALGICLYLHKTSGTVWFDEVAIYEYTPALQKELNANFYRQMLGHDLAKIKENANGDQGVLKKLQVFHDQLKSWMPEKRNDVKKGIPFFRLQQDIIGLNAEILQKKYPGAKILVSTADALKPYHHLNNDIVPLQGGIELHGFKNEKECFALNFTNCKNREETVILELDKDLKNLEVRQVAAVETKLCVTVDDALVRLRASADGKIRFTLPSGMTRQLFFVATLPDHAGKKNSLLKWKSSDASGVIRIYQNVVNDVLPEKLPIHSFSYMFPDRYKVHNRNKIRDKAISRMHQNAHMIFHVTRFRPVFDENGRIQPEKMKWNILDEELKVMLPGGIIIFNTVFESDPHLTIFLGKHKGKRIKPFSPEWESRASQFLKVLIEGLKKRGVGYDRILFCLEDEPDPVKLPEMEKMAAMIRKTDPNILIYNNFNTIMPLSGLKRLVEIVDVISPEKNSLKEEYLKLFREKGKTVWCYWVQNKHTGGNEIRDLLIFLQQKNITGFSYWCFYDMDNTWSAREQSYSVVYSGDPAEYIPSKRSEGIREGLEAYTLLWMLQQKEPAVYQRVIRKITNGNWLPLKAELLKNWQ
ncbi:MAG: hypothetical protein J6W81_03395 [Lentisphaeria bacterium]|nr:hypothetical protein [Lentisphaeria bacterium]